MRPGQVWLPSGSRLGATFLATDLRIAELSGFVCDVASQLEDSDQLARAVRAAAARHPAAVSAFELEARDDASLEREFSLSEQLTFPNERLPAALSFERRGAQMQIGVDALSALDLHTLLSMCGAGRFSSGRIL